MAKRLTPEERQAKRDRIRERLAYKMAVQTDQARKHIEQLMAAPGLSPAEEAQLPAKQVTVKTKTALRLLEMEASRVRAQTTADAGPRMLGLLVGVAKAPSIEAWEASAQAKDLTVDTTLGPAQLLPPKDRE